MKDSAIVAVCRLICGTALLITHAVTTVNGTLVVVSLFLLGVPVEAIQKYKSEGSE